MALKSVLNAELKRLKGEAKQLEKKRDVLTKDIDKKIDDNGKSQQLLQDYMDATFGPRKQKGPGKAKAAEATGGRRKRKSRKGVRNKILEAINGSPAGIKRNGILQKLNMVNDKAGHQYVSNTLRILVDDNQIRAQGRIYFPVGGGAAAASAPAATPASNPDPAPAAPSSSPSSGFSSGSPSAPERSSGFGSSGQDE